MLPSVPASSFSSRLSDGNAIARSPGAGAVSAASGTCDRPPASRRDGDCPLVVHNLADPGAVLVGEARRIGRQVDPGRHAALHRRPLADLPEPTLEIFELVDVLPLRLPTDRPGITNHVGDRLLCVGYI